jgi:hypothetical protein
MNYDNVVSIIIIIINKDKSAIQKLNEANKVKQ